MSENEIEAMGVACAALEPLSSESKVRAIQWLCARLELGEPWPSSWNAMGGRR